MEVRPVPTVEEAAAIVAAIEVAWPKVVVVPPPAPTADRWRFSGRWWAESLPHRRPRP